MSTHKIGFCGEIRKIQYFLVGEKCLIWSYGYVNVLQF